MTYSEEEIELFSRQFILKDFTEDKIKKLFNSKITIIGLGGIGCPLANYLVNSGIKNIQLIDGDIIEKNNLNRQILYSIDDLGKKKVNIAKRELLKINPECNIKIIDQNIDEFNKDYLLDSSIIIDTCDNWIAMKIINKFCVINSLPLISSSVVGFDIQIALFENTKNQHLCFNCIFPNENDVNLPRCETVGISGIAAGLAGLISAQKAINFLLNFKKETNILTLMSAMKGELQNINLKKNSNCHLKLF